MNVRDRIIELRRVPARDLAAHPLNFRRHPKRQREALAGVLREIGYAGALLARETPEGLVLIDGHLRAETTPDQDVPVLVLDVNEHEADLLLATYDPIGALAQADTQALDALLRDTSTGEEFVQTMLADLAVKEGITPPIDPLQEWQGMPAFQQDDLMPRRTVYVHFTDDEAVQDFARLIGQELTEKTKFVWYPPQNRRPLGSRYVGDES